MSTILETDKETIIEPRPEDVNPAPAPAPIVPPDTISSTELLILALTKRFEDYVTETDRALELLRADIGTVYKDQKMIADELRSRFGSQTNCKNCHRKVDLNAVRKGTCPVCGASLR